MIWKAFFIKGNCFCKEEAANREPTQDKKVKVYVFYILKVKEIEFY